MQGAKEITTHQNKICNERRGGGGNKQVLTTPIDDRDEVYFISDIP